MCTRFQADHPGMLSDVIVAPLAYRSKHNGRWYLTGECEHSKAIRGPYESEVEANERWTARVTELRAEKQRNREALEETLKKLKI